MRMTIFTAYLLCAFGTFGSTANAEVAISSPVDGSQVGLRPTIEGTVSDPDMHVWVVVHPLEVSTYWVQPRVTVSGNGSWKVKIYIGRSGSIDVDKLFEVRAFANPVQDLHEGLELDNWPIAAKQSDLVELIRE